MADQPDPIATVRAALDLADKATLGPDVGEVAGECRWREDGKAPAGSCPYCASRISMVERDGFFRARCSHRGCGATGPKMRSITRAADLFCCPPQRTAGGSAIAARPSTGRGRPPAAVSAEIRSRAIAALADECERLADLFDRIDTAFDQLRPAMADPFVAFVCATMHAAKDPAAPAPALLSDVPMGGDA